MIYSIKQNEKICLLHSFSVRESGTQARTGNEYGTGTRGTGSECEVRGVMGRRKIEKEKPAKSCVENR